MYGLQILSQPAEEPVTVAELRDWCRISGTDSDGILQGLGLAARQMLERQYGRAIVTQTLRMTLDNFPVPAGWEPLRYTPPWPPWWSIRLPRSPLVSVSQVRYLDLSDTLRVLATNVYRVDATREPGRITLAFGQVWPVTRPDPAAVQIDFVAGQAAHDVPEDIKLAIKFCVAAWIENRGEAPPGQSLTIPEAAKALMLSRWDGELEAGL